MHKEVTLHNKVTFDMMRVFVCSLRLIISSHGFLLVRCEGGVAAGGWGEEGEGRVGLDSSRAAVDITCKQE
jgi:hypothetical protein